MVAKDYLAIFFPREGFEWHNEDAWMVGRKFPIYAIADGITESLGEKMVHPSGPKKVADLFCRKSIEFLEKNFNKPSDEIIQSAYQYANKAAARFNKKNKEHYAAVGALVAVKMSKIYGSRVTDCGFALVRGGRLVFKTPEFWGWLKQQRRKGYGKIDGKGKIQDYIDLYELAYKKGDYLILFTDGFENHFSVRRFVNLFKLTNLSDLEEKIKQLDGELSEDDADKFGHERTLLIVRL